MKKKRIIVKKVMRLAPGKNALPGMKGSICINEDRKIDPVTRKVLSDNSVYLSQRDFRNSLLRLDINPDIRATMLIGATVEYEERTITPEELAAAGGVIAGMSNGRPLEWKTPGVKQFNHEVTAMADFKLSETDEINQRMNETTRKRIQEMTNQPAAPTRPQLEQPISDSEVIDDPVITEDVDKPVTTEDADPLPGGDAPTGENTEVKADADAETLIN